MLSISLYILSFFALALAQNNCGSEDWKSFKDQYCYKLIKTFTTWEDAHLICQEQSPPGEPDSYPIHIRSPEEQEFISTYIFEELGALDSVWIGAERIEDENGTTFRWSDGSDLTFTNWGESMPINDSVADAVEMKPGESGKWQNVPKSKSNLVLCFKVQSWSIYKLQQKLLALEQSQVPVGFIYTQLPGQPDPHQLWPNLEWQDVSDNYGGLFFRVFGGNSGPFDGTVQGGIAPRIIRMEKQTLGAWNAWIDVPLGTWSPWLKTGAEWGDVTSTRVFTSGDEVRPINTAVKIWRRV